jgi:hypothetical protein
MTELKDRLKNMRRKATADGATGRYIPELSLYSVLTADAIHEALNASQVNPHQREEIAQRVLQYGRKIFGILILLDQIPYIFKFAEALELDDSRLPFRSDVLNQEIGIPEPQSRDFEEKQWELLAPTFRRGTINRRFKKDIVLPFSKDTPISKGAFGTVYETVLDNEHQEFGHIFPEKVGLEYKIAQLPVLLITF